MWVLGALAGMLFLAAANSKDAKSTGSAAESLPLTLDERRRLDEHDQELKRARQNVEEAGAALQHARAACQSAEQEVGRAKGVAYVPVAFIGVAALVAALAVSVHGLGWRIPMFIMLAAIGISVAYLRHGMRLIDRAKGRYLELRKEIAERQRLLKFAEDKAKQHARENGNLREALRRGAEERLRAERDAAENRRREMQRVRAREEQEQALAEASRLERERNALEAERQRRGLATFLKAAFAHWQTVASDERRFLMVHAERLVREEERIMAAYQDSTAPGATFDDCLRLARCALLEFPAEVAYWLPDEETRTPERIAFIFRRYTGDYRERLLPAAQEIMFLRQNPGAHQLPAATAAGGRKSAALRRALEKLPQEIAEDAERRIGDALTLAQLGDVKRSLLASRRAELERWEFSEQEIEEELDTLAANLEALDGPWAAERGMITHAPRR